MQSRSDVMLLRAETPIHVGSGRSPREDVDLALRRERSTGYPFLPAATVKGAVRHRIEHTRAHSNRIRALFGSCGEVETGSDSGRRGAISFFDARLLLLPVRTAGGSPYWVTCPRILARFRRDLTSAAQTVSWNVPEPGSKALGTKENQRRIGTEVLMGGHTFQVGSHAAMDDLAKWFRKRIPPRPSPKRSRQDPRKGDRLASRLLALPDDAFVAVADRSTTVHTHIRCGRETNAPTARSNGVLCQEHLPPDTFLYCQVFACDSPPSAEEGSSSENSGARRQQTAPDLLSFVRRLDGRRLQLGSGASLGKGVAFVRFIAEDATSAHG